SYLPITIPTRRIPWNPPGGRRRIAITDFEDAIRIVVHRGRSMQKATGGGRMAVVGLDVVGTEAAIREANSGLAIATFNGPNAIVVRGETRLPKPGWSIDPPACPCGGNLRFVAVVTEAKPVRQTLVAMGLSPEPPARAQPRQAHLGWDEPA